MSPLNLPGLYKFLSDNKFPCAIFLCMGIWINFYVVLDYFPQQGQFILTQSFWTVETCNYFLIRIIACIYPLRKNLTMSIKLHYFFHLQPESIFDIFIQSSFGHLFYNRHTNLPTSSRDFLIDQKEVKFLKGCSA